jgi:hypothetical protein
MSTAGPLSDRPKTELANMARRRGVRGWETMNKEALIKALSRSAPAKTARPTPKAKPAKAAKPAAKAAKPKAVPKSAARVVAKPKAAKPAPKSAAKVTRPARPAARTAPAINGTHRVAAAATPVALGNGTPKAAGKPGATPPAKPGAAVPSKSAAVKPTAKPTTPAKSAPKPVAVKDVPAPRPSVPQAKDRVYLAVSDPYWLHVWWDISAASVQRAEAALKQDWYGARRIIRLFDVTSQDTTSTSETPIRDIPIEGDGRNWFVNVSQPPRQYRADVGYLSRRGDFFPVARSNVVTPPKAGSAESLDAWDDMDAKQAERILARSTGYESSGDSELREFFEKRLNQRLGPPKETAFGTGATPPGKLKKFDFEIDAKLIVFGRTDPTAHVTLGNDPIDLDPGGRFMMEFGLPDSRQIIPAVATSADGVEERTIVLAVERNTKYLDPMIHDQMNEV